MNSREIWTIDVSTGICLQLIVKTNETPREEPRVEALPRTNDQMAVTIPVAFGIL